MAVRVPYPLPIRQDEVLSGEIEADFAELRAMGPVVRAEFPFGGEGWIVTRYAEVKEVLSDPARFSGAEEFKGNYPGIRVGPPQNPPPSFTTMEPPEHTRHRAVLTKHLTVKRARALTPVAERIADECLDRLEEQGQPGDLVPAFTRLLPVSVLCHLLGVPVEDSPRFLEIVYPLANAQVTDPEEAREKLAYLRGYFRDLIERRKRDPGDDLISALLHDVDTHGVWSEEELNEVGIVLLGAGHDATSSILGGILTWLVHDPATYERLRADPEQIPRAFEEFVRILPAGLAGTHSRIAMEDTYIGSVLIKKGDAVLPIVHAANFDETVFRDADELKLDRQAGPHVAFGFGPHGCPGSQLARMEICAAVRRVLYRYARMTAHDPAPDWRRRMLLRGPKSLVVTWQEGN